ncbi:MAG: DUF721 domain-containing protein [Candidatus Krumholzibacteriota bacterium]|nr:DUF721 domain-containing protein [Candidatus Krumholzibacteriota bacterium]
MAGGRPEKQVGEILAGVLEGLGLDNRIEEKKLHEEWRDVVGEAVANHCRPGAIKDGNLQIIVKNNVWMQEIRFHQQQIVGRINGRFGKLGIKGIRLTIERETK